MYEVKDMQRDSKRALREFKLSKALNSWWFYVLAILTVPFSGKKWGSVLIAAVLPAMPITLFV